MTAAPPILVADIGGTNARFAMVARDGAGAQALAHRQTLRVEDFEDITDAARAYLESWPGERPAQGAFAVAGPTDEETIRFTSSPWSFQRASLGRALGLKDFRVLNDFEAQARGVRAMTDDAFALLKEGVADADAPLAVFGPGTGLGLSLLAPTPAGGLASR